MMSFRPAISAILLLTVFGYPAGAIDTLEVAAVLDTSAKQITGVTKYQLPGEYTGNAVEFQLFANLYSSESSSYLQKNPRLLRHFEQTGRWGGMAIDSVLLGDENISEYMEIDITQGVLTLPPDKTAAGKSIRIFFKTRIPCLGDRLSYWNDDYILDAWFPSPAVLLADNTWYNPRYGPFSEPVGDYHYYDVEFTCPRGLKMAAPVPGVETNSEDTLITTRFRFGPAHAFALLLSPDFSVESFQLASTNLRIFYHPAEEPALEKIASAVSRTFDYMTLSVGPYAYNDFTIVLNNASSGGALEFPAMAALPAPPGGTLMTNVYESIAIHETVHQWFYGIIGSDQTTSPWMDESVTQFFTLKILDHFWGEKGNLFNRAGFEFSLRDYLRLTSGSASRGYSLNCPAYQFMNGVDYYGIIYSRGPLALETIDNLLEVEGGSNFWKRYFDHFRFARPTPDDFARLVDTVGGKEVASALNFLINTPYEIDYAVLNLTNKRKDSLTTEVRLVLEKTAELQTPVGYRLILYNGDTLDAVWKPEANIEEIVLALPAPAAAAVIDPDFTYAIDADLINNSLILDGDSKPGLRLSSGLMFLMESLLSFIGGL
jgi:hypothetical protein